jgi:hypothetical protein
MGIGSAHRRRRQSITANTVGSGDRITARAPVDCLLVVPSTNREPPHPLHVILAELGMQVPVRTLLRRASGELGFRRPARDGFEIVERAAVQRVLLVDDVYTTGARINSAAYALNEAGHDVCGAFVIARRINPNYQPGTEEFWDQQKAQRFNWESSPIVNRRIP